LSLAAWSAASLADRRRSRAGLWWVVLWQGSVRGEYAFTFARRGQPGRNEWTVIHCPTRKSLLLAAA